MEIHMYFVDETLPSVQAATILVVLVEVSFSICLKYS